VQCDLSRQGAGINFLLAVQFSLISRQVHFSRSTIFSGALLGGLSHQIARIMQFLAILVRVKIDLFDQNRLNV